MIVNTESKKDYATVLERYSPLIEEIMNPYVICISKENEHLTYGKKYYIQQFVVDRLSAEYPNSKLAKVVNDIDKARYYSEKYFISIEEARDKKINKLLK